MLTEEELGRLALSRRFAFDILCDKSSQQLVATSLARQPSEDCLMHRYIPQLRYRCFRDFCTRSLLVSLSGLSNQAAPVCSRLCPTRHSLFVLDWRLRSCCGHRHGEYVGSFVCSLCPSVRLCGLPVVSAVCFSLHSFLASRGDVPWLSDLGPYLRFSCVSSPPFSN